MRIVELGLDQNTADVAVRERLAVPAADLPAVLADLRAVAPEVVVLSTCNRVELYLSAEHAPASRRQVVAYLVGRSGLTERQVEAATRTRYDAEAVRHLCRVATGLESMIVGEPEIAGQIRAALDAAESAGTVSITLRRLFGDALGVAGRLRAESGIGRQPVSVSTTAVRVGGEALGGLTERVALVVGAGSVGRAAARALAAGGVARLLVASRRRESAEALAARCDGEALELGRLPEALAVADLVVSATAAPGTVIAREVVEAALRSRPDRPLVLVDVAVPRDVDPTIRELAGCTLFDVDDLEGVREESLAARRLAAAGAEAEIDRAVERFLTWWRGRTVAPVVADLVAHAERVRRQEVERELARLGAPTERERALVEAATAALVKKLLHQPIVELKRRGADANGSAYVAAIGELFGLPSGPEPRPGVAGPHPGSADLLAGSM